MADQTDQRDALRPITRVAAVLFYSGAVVLAVFGIGALFSDDFSFLGVGAGEVCLTTSEYQIPIGSDTSPVPNVVHLSSELARVCTTAPTGGAIALGLLCSLPNVVLFLGASWMVLGVSRIAGRERVFSEPVVASLRRLAWWVVIGGVVAAAIQSWAEANLVALIIPDSHSDAPRAFMTNFPWGVLFAGVGVFTVARIVRLGVRETRAG
ncbi:hypothetical protein ABT324_17245 [Saccharopolyspora sp. NPDC000359]|uniref:hypothetical protein n=1 Tax=Saccharopolyspora sp. NPDC000359 TaxID=3154251 RepID=UPI00332D5A8B